MRKLFASLRAEPKRGYAICTAPRSGSNYLCQLLTSTGKLGAPLEYFNGQSRRIFEDPDYPDQPKAQIAKILTAGSTPNRVYGLKVFNYQHRAVAAQMDWPAKLPELKYVYLKRNDIISQAISWARAKQTGQYRASQPALGNPRYDPAQILECLVHIQQEYAGWDAYFDASSIKPLKLTYEDVVKNPQGAVDAIAGMLGANPGCAVEMAHVTVNVQSDETSRQWRQRFLQDTPDVGHRTR
ncbi:MAG: Stf0 family sulfotransferase [Rhizobiaceae bacterium]